MTIFSSPKKFYFSALLITLILPDPAKAEALEDQMDAIADPATSKQEAAPDEPKNPCLPVREACAAAGYEPGAYKEGKALVFHCMIPILYENKVPAGVTVTPEQIAACKAKPRPCMDIKAECKKQGYYPGGWKEGKGVAWQCMMPIVGLNQTVSGVNPPPATVDACQEKPRPCMRLMAACSAAGLGPQKQPDGSYKATSCVKDLLAGKPPAGVAYNEMDVQACQKRREDLGVPVSQGDGARGSSGGVIEGK